LAGQGCDYAFQAIGLKQILRGEEPFMSKSIILKIIVAIAIIGGGVFVIFKDDPATPTKIDSIDPLPTQDQQ
jgi:hypothetical protein